MSERPNEEDGDVVQPAVPKEHPRARAVGGEGLSPGLTPQDWPSIREMTYDGRGGCSA